MRPALLFRVSPASGVPIYRQLMDQVHSLVAGGRLKPGEFLPSVRQVAEDLQVNPMTVSKAYSLLERDGVLEMVRGQGMRLAERQSRGGVRARQEDLMPLLQQIAAKAFHLSLTREQVIEQLRKVMDENHHE